MGLFISKRLLQLIPILVFLSVVSFFIIQLPPGDFLNMHVSRLRQSGEVVNHEEILALQRRYGLDQPAVGRYFLWASRFVRGDFGYSFEWNRPVNELIWERLGLTVVVALSTLLFSWIVAFIIGLYAATHQYSLGDYLATFLGFIGLAIPNFLLALVLMWVAYSYFGQEVGGLFSRAYVTAPWSLARFWDMLKHLWIPVVVIGTGGTAGLIRILRANILDELKKPYVMSAQARGLSRTQVLLKYPVRVALIPFLSTAGWTLPLLISGETITSVVLNLPTTGPLLLRALQSQDMYLAGSFIMFLSILTVLGTVISDILLAWADPRIRYE